MSTGFVLVGHGTMEASSSEPLSPSDRKLYYKRQSFSSQPPAGATFHEARAEALRNAVQFKQDEDVKVTRGDRVWYWIENSVAANPNTRFYMLGGLVILAMV